MRSRLIAVAALALGLAAVSVSPAIAQQGGQQDSGSTWSADLTELNGSGSSGRATVSLEGNRLTVDIQSQGLSPNLPHAQHFHIGGRNVCPDASADGDGDGLINTAEGQPAYGPVKVSLTTEGDAGADSALAVDRFPTADANGSLNYTRTFDLPSGVTEEDVRNAVVVQHGIAKLTGDPAKYDGEKKSSLSEELPIEATIPANCGKLTAAQVSQMPTNAPAAGFGGTSSGPMNALPIALAVAMFGGVAMMTSQHLRAGRRSLS